MRSITALFLVFICIHVSAAEDFTVFEKDGRYGVKDERGAVIVPAVYNQLGWSNGDNQIFEGVIGYRQNGLWGLVSVKNKVLSESKFYTLSPLSESYIKASVKGRFSNQLFYGLLKTDGEIQIGFNYADLEKKGDYLLAMSFNRLESQVGVINLSNEVVIPLKYQSIDDQGPFLLAKGANQKFDVFYGLKPVAQDLDSVKVMDGLIGFRCGKVGFLDGRGEKTHEFEFKTISNQHGSVTAVSFPSWEIHDASGGVFRTNGDSVSYQNGVWITHMNGAQHFRFSSEDIDLTEYIFEGAAHDKLILNHSKTRKWSVRDLKGNIVVDDQDYIEAAGEYFLTVKGQKWHAFNAYGTRISNLPFDEIRQADDNYFIARNNKYWGVIDFRGDTYITFKYDSIISSPAGYYAVQFLDKWGITDRHGNWKVNPEFDSIEIFENLIKAKKGLAYSYFNDGNFLVKSTFAAKAFLGDFLLIEDEHGKRGLMDTAGRLVTYPSFDDIQQSGQYLVFQSGDTSAIFSTTTDVLIDFESGYQAFGRIDGGYIPAKKNGRWGFIDFEGRLRISNRYEAVKAFKEGFAAVKLRGRWGFINENERLVIQPHYQEVLPFEGNIAVVRSKDLWGLIDKRGKEVVGIKWTSITRTAKGNYIVSDENGSTGLVDPEGFFLLRPNYDEIQDTDLGVIVKKDGMVGLLDYDGRQIYNLIYTSIRREGEFLMMAK